MNVKLITLFLTLLSPLFIYAQQVKFPSTPKDQWVLIISSVADVKTKQPIDANFKLIDTVDSVTVCEGQSTYESWTSNNGPCEIERIVFILPDFKKKYTLKVVKENYNDANVDIDYSKIITLKTPIEEREIRIDPVFLTKKQ